MRKRYVAAAAALSIAAATSVLALWPDGTSTDLMECGIWGASLEGSRCLEERLIASITTHGAEEADAMLAEFLTENPEYAMECHRIGHDAGSAAFKDFSDLSNALQTLKEEVCMSAVAHGIIDAWAAAEGSLDEWPQAVALCDASAEKWPEPGEGDHSIVGRCAEGLGHAAYEIGGGPELCAEFSTHQGQRECGSGVVMQLYLPVAAPAGHVSPTLDALVSICETWPPAAAIEGCYIGVPYGLQELFNAESYRWHTARGTHGEQAALNAFISGYEEALEYCRRLGADGYTVCSRSTLQWVLIIDEIRTDPNAIERLCGTTSEALQDECFGRRTGNRP